MSEARVELLSLVGSLAAWRRIGLTVTDTEVGSGADVGEVPFMFTSLRIVPDDGAIGEGPGIVGWSLSGIDPEVTSIDGLATEVVPARDPVVADHPNGAIELDHVVVLTSSLDRTCGAIEAATGSPLKRVREVGSMRQGFHRLGSGGLVVEVVERPEVTDGHASFWGLVINVRDLDVAVDLIGADRIGEPIDAVQPGRRIATVRGAAGLGTAVALMTPP
ncbi:MAG: hypothetical protein WD225_03545 [Ilumatobacteraceae bacterium]